MLLREAPGDGDRFTVGEQEAGKRDRYECRDVGYVDIRDANIRQAGWQVADNMNAFVRLSENRHKEDGGNNNDKGCRTAGESPFKAYKKSDRGEANDE